MASLFQVMLGAPVALVIVGGGALWMIATCVLAHRRSARIQARALELLELALAGKADQARIQARTDSASLGPLLTTLGGTIDRPSPYSWTREIMLVLAMLLPLLALVGHAAALLVTRSMNDRIAASVTLLIGCAVLLPLALAGCLAVVELGGRASRVVRGACVAILARNLRGDDDARIGVARIRGTSGQGTRGE